ncbi:DUF3306 domain-containing protein [Caenimonas aquaedulcis]|uniref:DUF3306 domain-containing protein n=1 Tax=Caenimonas aquaedulcis TaxID=2793270 RepID=A0A931MGK0_9BURK|nr:DUF3306 domain-containing protein [Caenimonas aquaedulcis]MBG9388098.1 DUF3306 domain-containing protein [Caenimonas aquaedulcis]
MSDGFLGRWSRRKLEVKEGREVPPEPVAEISPASPRPAPASGTGSEPAALLAGDPPPPPPPPPTLEEAHSLTPDSDFRRFATREVAPEVKNAAMKKLFADPRYNVMDGLDIYTGDYSQPDPMPESMLRQLASAKFLGFFADEDKQDEAAAAPQTRDVADDPTGQSVAQSDPAPPAVPEGPDTHADADLRLQQDHAAAGEDPGRGTGREPDAA